VAWWPDDRSPRSGPVEAVASSVALRPYVDPGETTTVEHTLELAAGSHVLAANGVEAGTVLIERNEPAPAEPPQVTAEPSEPDAGSPWIWLVLALLVGLAVVGVAVRRRRD
jgi:hypothetical protein